MNKLIAQLKFGLSNLDVIREVAFAVKHPSLVPWRIHGLNIHLLKKLRTPYFQSFHIDTIYDIGANIGQSTMLLTLAFPTAKIHVFEPLPDCYQTLARTFRNHPHIKLHNVALGNQTGQITFEQNEFSASSSVLPMTDEHKQNFSFTAAHKPITVPIDTLDEYHRQVDEPKNILVKIDVQGYEDQVIKGGLTALKQAKVVIVETSFSRLYEGEALFNDIYTTLQSSGFTYKGAFDQLLSPLTGEILQQDALFVRQP